MLEADQDKNMEFRLIVDDPFDGAWNMAVDEALMESAGEPGSSPVFRLYGFRPSTLTVGRFQKTDGVFDFRLLEGSGIAFVRRPSGGQAVLHDREVTYSVALGRHHLADFGRRAVYRLIVPVLLSGLRRLGVTGEEAAGRSNSRDPDCFASTGEYEIDGTENQKLIGSAQMVSRTGVLQHGSIPLDRANRDIYRYLCNGGAENHSTSISEEVGRIVGFADAVAAFSDVALEMLSATGDSLDERETRRAGELLETRYRRSEWNRKY